MPGGGGGILAPPMPLTGLMVGSAHRLFQAVLLLLALTVLLLAGFLNRDIGLFTP